MYNNGHTTCPNCKKNYQYKFETVEEIEWRSVAKQYGKYFLQFVLALVTLFMSVGVSYNARVAQQMIAIMSNYTIWMAFAILFSGLTNFVYYCIWSITIVAWAADGKVVIPVLKFQILFACFVAISQIIGIMIISISTNDFMFNVFTYVIGSSIVAIPTVPGLTIWYNKPYIKSYLVNNYGITKTKLVVANKV